MRGEVRTGTERICIREYRKRSADVADRSPQPFNTRLRGYGSVLRHMLAQVGWGADRAGRLV